MSFTFTVSPDFTPDHLSGWYIFNTWLQRQTDLAIHLEMFDDFHQQREAIGHDRIDLIYANPYDAAMLVREKNFVPLVKPQGVSDEAIIAVSAESSVTCVTDLKSGTRVAYTDDPDVRLMGMIMLEPGDLEAGNIQGVPCDTYVLVAKHVLQGDADVGIFLAEAFDDLSAMIKKRLRVLVRSQIDVIHHALMVGPRLHDKKQLLEQCLLNMTHDSKGLGVLESLKFKGWEKVENEEMEFMIDLMDTLSG
ncbi:MAG: hypothetical protein Kow0065_06930 [Methylomicrobium sp.]